MSAQSEQTYQQKFSVGPLRSCARGLNSGIVPSSDQPADSGAASPADAGTENAAGSRLKIARLIATVTGILGVLLAALTPLLPVDGTDARFQWPQGQELSAESSSISAPLIAQTPATLDIRIPCPVLAELAPEATRILSTMPSNAQAAQASSLFITASPDTVSVSFRNTVAASANRADLADCSELQVWSAPSGPGAQFVGLGEPATLDPERRPQVTGIFSDLSTEQVQAAATQGLRADVRIDTRYASSPSTLKLLVMILAILSIITSLVALAVIDRHLGYHRLGYRRPRREWRTYLRTWRPVDVAMTGVLLVWTFLGSGSPDDGYILNMGRTSDTTGYLSNYYRWYDIPEAPFDWYYSLLAQWASISPSILWMQIPSMLAGLASWFILSRVLLPMLGPAIRRNAWAYWAAAGVFGSFWLAFCSGLRSEAMIVLGSLLVWWAAERAILTRRLLPAALAALGAGFTLALAPHGVIAVAILLVSARPMLRVLLGRRHEVGLLPLLAPLLAASSLIIVIVFRDQTLATVLEAIRVRLQVGPVIGWHQEYLRYYFITVMTDDGSLTRRVPLLLLLAGAIVTVAVMLRRTKIRGVATAPTWRLIGAIGLTLVLFIFTPTKWTIHFGVFAGLAAAVAATATLAISESAARSARNLTVFISGLLFALAAAMAGENAWPYGYTYGISWFDRAPVLAGFPISTIFLVLAVATAAIAVWQHLRLDYVANKGLSHVTDGPGETRADRRRLFLASSPIAVIACLLMLAEVAVFAKGALTRYPTTTVFSQNLDTLRGNSCGMANTVLVEPDANRGFLTPASGRNATQALEGENSVGFTPNGIANDLTPEDGTSRPGQMNVAASPSRPFVVVGGTGAGTTGSYGPQTVNGSNVGLPYGLDPATTPVLGSYGYMGEARLITDWYELPDRAASPLLVFSTAGAVATIDRFGARVFGQELLVQFGVAGADGEFEQVGPDVIPIDPGPVIPNRPWRNLRVPMDAAPPEATVMRLSLLDNNLGEMQFIGITPPRAPVLQPLQELVGSTDPTLIDFTVAAHFPCQNPLRIVDGVAQVPQWRIMADYATANSQAKTWQWWTDGGLLGISMPTTSAQAVPAYLDGDWHQDWGALERLSPLTPDAAPVQVQTTTETRWGWSHDGSLRLEPRRND